MNVREDHIVEVGESRNSQDSSGDPANSSPNCLSVSTERCQPISSTPSLGYGFPGVRSEAGVVRMDHVVSLAFMNPVTNLRWRPPVGGLGGTFISTCRSSVKPAFQKWAVRNRQRVPTSVFLCRKSFNAIGEGRLVDFCNYTSSGCMPGYSTFTTSGQFRKKLTSRSLPSAESDSKV